MKKYVITTAVPGAKVNQTFYKSLQSYCKKNKAQLVILKSTNVYKEDVIDPSLESLVLDQDMMLNKKLHISTIPINPMAINPTVGLSRQSQTDGSFIFASPKQSLESIATSNTKLPHVLMTTGAVTRPYYRPTRNGIIAAQDHVNGAIVVDIHNDTFFQYRQVQADTDGSFIDMFIKYSSDGKIKYVSAKAIIPGDLHSGSTDPSCKKAIFDLISLGKPEMFIGHDLADFISINPHLEGKNLSKSKVTVNLDQELDVIHSELKDYATAIKKANKNAKFYVVESNHDDFLNRYLESGKYVHDRDNYATGHRLVVADLDGHYPLEYAMKQRSPLSNVKFLRVDDDLRVTKKKVQLGAHGHLGPNGSRGSAANLERSYANAFIGHSHSPKILRNIWQVGTSTYMKLGYNKGPSGWLHSIGILYPNGSKQMINIIDGKWR